MTAITESVESCDLRRYPVGVVYIGVPLSEHFAVPALVGRSAGLLDQYAILGMHVPKWSVSGPRTR